MVHIELRENLSLSLYIHILCVCFMGFEDITPFYFTENEDAGI